MNYLRTSVVTITIPLLTVVASFARETVTLENSTAMVMIDLGGGSITDFHLKSVPVNPLLWNQSAAGSEPRTMGHFICFDRWGPPSDTEAENGMPFHGEAAKVHWKLLTKPQKRNGTIYAQTKCQLPMAGLTFTRHIYLDDERPVFEVTEEITNTRELGRIYNLVQHVTIAPPFLTESTIISADPGPGFSQEGKMPNPEDLAVTWPATQYKGEEIDLTHLRSPAGPSVVSFALKNSEEYAWVTAANPDQQCLIGYFWRTEQYPWLNMWRNTRAGQPAAFGMEFGTTGLHKPFKSLVEKRQIFENQLFEYIDAAETIEKSYTGFLTKLPRNFKGVADIEFSEDKIILVEDNPRKPRRITVWLK